MKIISITCLLIAMIAVQLPMPLQANPPSPTLTCSIEKPLNPPSGTPFSYDVSSMGWLVMDISIDTKGGGQLAEGNVPINPTGILPASYLVITATNSSGTSVPVNGRITGSPAGPGGYIVTFFLPEDTTTRTTKEQAYIDHIKATDTASSSTSLAWVTSNNTKALAAIDQIYTQSRVGAITLTVKYVSAQAGLWNGTVQGASIIANVENKGDQLNSLH